MQKEATNISTITLKAQSHTRQECLQSYIVVTNKNRTAPSLNNLLVFTKLHYFFQGHISKWSNFLLHITKKNKRNSSLVNENWVHIQTSMICTSTWADNIFTKLKRAKTPFFNCIEAASRIFATEDSWSKLDSSRAFKRYYLHHLDKI